MKKRIILCCDGTWNDLEMRYITNVGRLAQALTPQGDDGLPQLIYYDDGIGANDQGLKRLITGGIGLGMERNIYEAYRFLCFNYVPGDEVCLFGFSRGAYTVRSLAGMIGKAGLVKSQNLKQVPEAQTIYRDRASGHAKRAEAFRKEFSAEIKITLLGCWDTVGALGVPDKTHWLSIDDLGKQYYEFHDTNLGHHIQRALHAVAIDERRMEFDVTPMNKSKNAPASQKLKEVWFPGDHGSVGGGTWEKRALSNVALVWMLDETRKLGVKIGADLNRLNDDCDSDPSIFYDESIAFIYSDKARKIPSNTRAEQLHSTVSRRWQELPSYRPNNLPKALKKQLDTSKVKGLRKPLANPKKLKVGQSAWVRVESREKYNAAKIKVIAGERYEIKISNLQVWKDGDLDPCDVAGWNILTKSAEAKPAWKDGKPHTFGKMKRLFLQKAAKKRLVKDADWFELVASVNMDGFRPLYLKTSKKTSEIVSTIEIDANGELFFAANDLASKWDIVDQYDNNQGWGWVAVKRLK